MKCYISVLCVLSAFVAVNLAAPTTLDETDLVPFHHQVVKRQADSQQALVDRIVAYSNNKIAYLRTLSPTLFEILDSVVQNVTSQIFRVVGGTLLRSGGLGGSGGGGGGGSSGGSRVSVVLPTFPPDDDEDEDEESSEEIDLRVNPGSSSSSSPLALRVRSSSDRKADLKTANTDNNEIVNNEVSDDLISSSTIAPITSTTLLDLSTTSSDSITTTVVNSPEPFTSPSLVESGSIKKRHVRVTRATEDQKPVASVGTAPDPAEDISNVESDDADRNKRFLPFGGEGGSGGGSGNFLFDLIRNTADRAARTVGTVYRMVAGTENLGFGISATATSSKTLATAPASQLVAGSGGTEETDEKDGGVAEVDVTGKSAEGIPGPITRLLVVANRGIANLIQDLILRLAQTSERIVNFKARLVTALI